MSPMNGRAAASLSLTALLVQAPPPEFKAASTSFASTLSCSTGAAAGCRPYEQDFRVTEDGKPLRIAGFEAVTIR